MKAVALGKELVELAAIALELRAFVEHFAKGILNNLNAVADTDLSAQSLLQIGRGTQVVGMDMRLEQPLHIEIMLFDVSNDAVRRSSIGAARGIVEVQNAVDNGTGPPRGVLHEIRYGIRGVVEKAGDDRCHARASLR